MHIMSQVEEKLAKSLTADTVELIPYLPYLLQDLWELGSSPVDIIHLIKKHIPITPNSRILDLGCGKGAVSIKIAKTFASHIKGIDIMPSFILTAREKAAMFGVESLCLFVVEDINVSVKFEKNYDIVILGAVGSVLGNPEETLQKLSNVIKQNGYLILDDGYAINGDDDTYTTKETWLKHITNSGFTLIEDLLVDEVQFDEVLEEQITVLSKRVEELKQQYPDRSHLFDQYLASQKAEIHDLTTDVIGVTLLLKKVN